MSDYKSINDSLNFVKEAVNDLGKELVKEIIAKESFSSNKMWSFSFKNSTYIADNEPALSDFNCFEGGQAYLVSATDSYTNERCIAVFDVPKCTTGGELTSVLEALGADSMIFGARLDDE